MGDLLVIVPTRGRPLSALRLVEAMTATCQAGTHLAFAVDDDDPAWWPAEATWPDFVHVHRGPRQNCIRWTNQIAGIHEGDYWALASFGDDHVPQTPGWDSAMLAAIDDMDGTGIVYGDDLVMHENLPTAPVISSNIVEALGWMMYPKMTYVFADNVWLDLGREAGCLRYLSGVIIEHVHHITGRAEHDQTYIDAESGGSWGHDEAVYRDWKAGQMAEDVEKIKALRA